MSLQERLQKNAQSMSQQTLVLFPIHFFKNAYFWVAQEKRLIEIWQNLHSFSKILFFLNAPSSFVRINRLVDGALREMVTSFANKGFSHTTDHMKNILFLPL